MVPGLPPFTLRTHRQERVGTILSKSCSRLDVQNAHLVFGAKALKDMDRIDELSINDGSTVFLLWRLWGGTKTPQKGKASAKKLEIEDETVSSIDHDIYIDYVEDMDQINRVKAEIDPSSKYEIYTDGACRGNPGPAGVGFIILDQIEIFSTSMPIRECTNNAAEYLAVIYSLRIAPQLGIQEATIYSDSELVVKQLLGKISSQ